MSEHIWWIQQKIILPWCACYRRGRNHWELVCRKVNKEKSNFLFCYKKVGGHGIVHIIVVANYDQILRFSAYDRVCDNGLSVSLERRICCFLFIIIVVGVDDDDDDVVVVVVVLTFIPRR